MTLAILGTGGHAKSIFDIVKKNCIFLIKQKKFKVGNRTFNVMGDHNTMISFKKNF